MLEAKHAQNLSTDLCCVQAAAYLHRGMIAAQQTLH